MAGGTGGQPVEATGPEACNLLFARVIENHESWPLSSASSSATAAGSGRKERWGKGLSSVFPCQRRKLRIILKVNSTVKGESGHES